MASFDFINAPEFRDSLETDYRDMKKAFDSESWKVVHVLAGSITEAVLADYLLSTDYKERTGKDPLRLALAAMISACTEDKSLSNRVVDLSNVIRDYRNLIHPGRTVRLSESPDRDTAQVAMSLVEIIVRQIEENRQKSYGLTAEQLVTKVVSDHSSMTILNHLLCDMHDHEKARLLLELIPEKYFDASYPASYDPSQDEENLSRCFRAAFASSSDQTKRRVCERYIEILREEAGYKVLTYETEFFRCTDLSFLADAERQVAKTHILSQLERNQSSSLLIALEGISDYLSIDEVDAFVDPLLTLYISNNHKDLIKARLHEATGARLFATSVTKAIVKRIDIWIAHSDKKGYSDTAETLRELKAQIDIPF